MIKKFKEFNETLRKDISDIITKEEVEDHFLRLKEVFNCDIIIDIDDNYNYSGNIKHYYSIRVEGSIYIPELNQIKHRIEVIHPTLEVFTVVKKQNDICYCYICERANKLHNDICVKRMITNSPDWRLLD